MNKNEHVLEKIDKQWVCKICGLTWKRKPKKKCEGIPAIDYKDKPLNSIWDFSLDRNNLRVKQDAKPVAYHHKPSFRHNYCYALIDCVKLREYVPDLILSKEEKDKLGYKTKHQLGKLYLKPIENARACGVYYWDKEYGCGSFAIFYHPDDTEFYDRDEYLTKTTLKKIYLLPESWIKRIGKCDKQLEHEDYGTPIYLYSRKRIEKFLADNSEEYSLWLDKRENYVARALPLLKLIENKKLQKQQQKKCLKCASSCAMETGLFCVIHPMGLPIDKLPCPDFVEGKLSYIY